MSPRKDEAGFTLIELLVAIALFSVVSVTFYTALFSGVRGANASRSIVRVSEEARLGFNRMVRDTREAASFVSVSPTSYRIQTDFDRDESFESPNQNGDYEDVTFTYADGEITMSTPTLPAGEVLMRGVVPIPGQDVFSFAGNLLEYDTVPVGGDGMTTCLELDNAASPAVGNGNGTCDAGEMPFLSSVRYAFAVNEDDRTTNFFTQAELRNKR